MSHRTMPSTTRTMSQRCIDFNDVYIVMIALLSRISLGLRLIPRAHDSWLRSRTPGGLRSVASMEQPDYSSWSTEELVKRVTLLEQQLQDQTTKWVSSLSENASASLILIA